MNQRWPFPPIVRTNHQAWLPTVQQWQMIQRNKIKRAWTFKVSNSFCRYLAKNAAIVEAVGLCHPKNPVPIWLRIAALGVFQVTSKTTSHHSSFVLKPQRTKKLWKLNHLCYVEPTPLISPQRQQILIAKVLHHAISQSKLCRSIQLLKIIKTWLKANKMRMLRAPNSCLSPLEWSQFQTMKTWPWNLS